MLAGGDMQQEATIYFNNNFIERNRNIAGFFREQDREKRVAFNRIRDEFLYRAHQKRAQIEDMRIMRLQEQRMKEEEYRRVVIEEGKI